MDKNCIAVVYGYKGKEPFKVLIAEWIVSFYSEKKELKDKISNFVCEEKNNHYRVYCFENEKDCLLNILKENNINFNEEKVTLNIKQRKIIDKAQKEKWNLDRIRRELEEVM